MVDQTDTLALPYILPSQAQKHVTHNEALAVPFDVVIYQLSATFGRGIGTRITIDG